MVWWVEVSRKHSLWCSSFFRSNAVVTALGTYLPHASVNQPPSPLFWKHQDLCPPLAVAEIVALHDKHFLAFSDWNTLPVHTYVRRTSRKVNILKIVVDYHRREMILATWGFKLSFQNDCHYLHNQLALPVCIRKLFFLTYFFIRWVPEMEHFKLSVYISVALPKALRENVYTWL